MVKLKKIDTIIFRKLWKLEPDQNSYQKRILKKYYEYRASEEELEKLKKELLRA